MIDESLANYGNLAFQSSFAIYFLALCLFMGNFALTRTKAPDRALVSSGAPSGPGRVETPQGKSLGERLGNMASSVLVVGIAAHVLSIVLRGFATHRFPLGNMYEFVTMACAAAMLVGSIFLRGEKFRTTWTFVLVPVLILMFLAGTILYAEAAPVVPALRSFWLPIHVTVISAGAGVFLVSGVASVLFLLKVKKGDSTLTKRLPDAETLDRLAYRTSIIGFPIFGAGVILGAIWAEAAWGRFWGWDPKETVSFITWVIYAAYLHARATSGWRDTKAAWINVVGFAAMMFNLFIINMVVSGLHSYAGLN